MSDILRVVTDETPPLPKSELQKRGNELLTEARNAGLAALRKKNVGRSNRG